MNPHVKSRAILVHPLIGIPGNIKSDETMTSDIIEEKNLGESAGKWVRQLYPSKALKPIAKFVGDCRRYHNGRTLYWPDDGWGMLPMAMHDSYNAEMLRRKGEFEQLRDEFLNNYPEWVEWAREEHGSTFNEAIYKPEIARAKFIFTMEYRPIPESSQFVDSIARLLGQDAASVDEQVDAAVKKAKEELIKRLAAPIQNMVMRLSSPESKFHDSLIDNIKDITNLIPSLNITNDPDLAALSSEAVEHLTSHSPDTLRINPMLRSETAKKAEDILRKMKGVSY